MPNPSKADAGRPKARSSRTMVTCRLPEDVVQRLREVAQATGISQTDLVASGIRTLLNKPEIDRLVRATKKAGLLLRS